MRLWMGIMCAALVVPGCGDDDGGSGGGSDAAVDAAVADAGQPDATPLCPGGRFAFSDDYLDSETGAGVFDAQVTEVGNPSNTTDTAPNGRAILCLPAEQDSDVSFTHPDYMTVVQTVGLAAAAVEVVYPTGYEPANLDAVYAAQKLTRDAAGATVIIDVRGYPGGGAVAPLTVTIDADSDGSFTPAAQPTQVWFANVDTSGGEVSFTVTAPDDPGCLGRETIPVAAGQIAFTAWSCQ